MQATPTPTPTSIGAATAAHTHSADKIVIALTPLNSFAVLSGWENSLTIFPSIKQAVLAFGLSRPTLPGAVTTIFSWSSDYSTGSPKFCPSRILTTGGFEGSTFLFLNGSILQFNPSGLTGTNISAAVGGAVFSYA